MKFELIPVLSSMASLYKMPLNRERFDSYLSLLQGNSSDELKLPITSYNPMGKTHVLEKIEALLDIDAEALASSELEKINKSLAGNPERTMQVVLNVSDDVGGAWSHRFETDYASKFKIGPLVKRDFCTPHFWTSEEYHDNLVINRVQQYAYRTFYWLENGAPVSLSEHLEQELYVVRKSEITGNNLSRSEFALVDEFYRKNQHDQNYSLIFNFFYGDSASDQLGYHKYGLPEWAGIRYLQML